MARTIPTCTRLRLIASLLAFLAAWAVTGAPAQAAPPRTHGRRTHAHRPATRRRVLDAAQRRRHHRHRRHRRAAGVRTTAPSAQARAQALAQLTGLAPSQVVARNVCNAPRPGHVRCAAEQIYARADHRPVHPAAQPVRSFTQVFPRIAGGIRPQSTSTGVVPPSAGTPAYLQQAYDLGYLSQTAGSGDTVAIVDVGDDPTAESDLAAYRSTFGLPACTTANGCFHKLNQNGSASPLPAADTSWWTEMSLDLDAVSALCPNCHIDLIETNSSAFADMDQGDIEAAALGAQQISDSWSGGSSGTFGGTYTFAHAAVIAATGDNGYLGAGAEGYPAALPGVTAAGGTSLTGGSGAGAAARGFSESAWSGAGAGCNPYYAKPGYQTDSGCTGRSWADVSADADPNTGLVIRDNGSWELVGGTSLATPLIAAFEAVTGISTTSPQWAYGDAAQLNDPSSGSDGSCAASIWYICTARTGYDGPTGEGSISGAIALGAPGVAGPVFGGGYVQSLTATGASLTGGIDPNGLATSYYWQYGTTTSYGQQTTAVSAGSGAAPSAVTTALTGLTPSTTYHYRLVAQNSDGTTYGYDYTFSTSSGAPVYATLPTSSGASVQGATLTATTPGTWNPTATTYTYQWQIATSPTSGWLNITGATTTSYTIPSSGLGATYRVCVTATNSYGTGSKCATPIGPITSGAPVSTTLPTTSGSRLVGTTLTATTPGTWNPTATTYTYQWQIATSPTSGWLNITGATTTSYTIPSSGLGATYRVCVTATNSYGTGSKCATPIGPITSGAPVSTTLPTTSGSGLVGTTLTATTPGTWNPTATTYTYQWQIATSPTSGWLNITGATTTSYTIPSSGLGATYRVCITATNSYGTGSKCATPIGPITSGAPVSTTLPTTSGSGLVGTTLTATTPGTWNPTATTYTYQWQIATSPTSGWLNITGATTTSYTIPSSGLGATYRVCVTATNSYGTGSKCATPIGPVTS